MGRAPERNAAPSPGDESVVRLLAQSVSDVLWTVDVDLRITYVNPAAEAFLRCPLEEVRRRPFTDWLTEASRGKIAAARRLAGEYLQPAPDEASPFAALDLEIVCADGRRKWTETTFATLYDDSGAVKGYAGITRDVTERRRIQTWLREAHQELEKQALGHADELRAANEQLRAEVDRRHAALQDALKSERKFRDLAEGIGEGVVIVVGDEIRWANQAMAELLGRAKEDLAGRRIDSLLPPEGREMLRQRQARILAGDPSGRRFETSALAADGRRCDLEVTAQRVIFEEEEAVQYIVRDITERRETERQLAQHERLASLGQIVAGVAHEINNPNSFIAMNLPTLRLYCEALLTALERSGPPPTLAGMAADAFVVDLRQMLRDMEFGSKRITRIVSELRDFARPSGDHGLSVQPLGPVLERSLLLVGSELRKSVRSVDVQLADDLPPLLMNAERLGQVFVNLLINAAHAADKEDSWIAVRARRDAERPGFVQVVVADNGCGIAPDLLERIFSPFVTSKKDSRGTGLGLAICRKIIDEHRGVITVRSDVGAGAQFTLRLPISAAQP